MALESIYDLILSLTPAIVAGVIGYFTIQYSRMQHERSAMSDIFEMLDGSGHKNAEINLRDAYRRGVLMKDGKLNSDHENPASVVSRNYAQVGAMLSSRLIPKRQYYEKFGVITVVSYYILKEVIEQERHEFKYHRAYFTNLAIDCFEYWDGMSEDDKPTIRAPNDTIIKREMLGKKVKIPKRVFFRPSSPDA